MQTTWCFYAYTHPQTMEVNVTKFHTHITEIEKSQMCWRSQCLSWTLPCSQQFSLEQFYSDETVDSAFSGLL